MGGFYSGITTPENRVIAAQTTRELLIKARALIEACWHQGDFAADADHNEVALDDDKATCFCPLGAVARCAGVTTRVAPDYAGNPHNEWSLPIICPERALYRAGERALAKALPSGDCVAGWNDDPMRTKGQALMLFDMAISAQPLPHNDGESVTCRSQRHT